MLAVLVKFPFATRPWALPVLIDLYRSEEDDRRLRPMWVVVVPAESPIVSFDRTISAAAKPMRRFSIANLFSRTRNELSYRNGS